MWIFVSVCLTNRGNVFVQGVTVVCFCVFRASVSWSTSDGEVHSVDGSLHCEERCCSAAQQYRHYAYPALHQLHRPHQQPCCRSVPI